MATTSAALAAADAAEAAVTAAHAAVQLSTGSASAPLEDCSAADLFAVVASIVLQDDAVSTGFCGVTCASSARAVSLPTCSLLCVLDGSELCSGWVLPAFALCTCASLVRPAADHGSRAGFRATAAVLLGFASSMVAHPVLGALFLPSLFAVAAHVLHAVSPAICFSDCLWGGTSTSNGR